MAYNLIWIIYLKCLKITDYCIHSSTQSTVLKQHSTVRIGTVDHEAAWSTFRWCCRPWGPPWSTTNCFHRVFTLLPDLVTTLMLQKIYIYASLRAFNARIHKKKKIYYKKEKAKHFLNTLYYSHLAS